MEHTRKPQTSGLSARHFASTLVALVLAAPMLPVSAATADDKPMSPQQKKMSACSKDAKGKSGDERRAFMKKCLSAKAPATQADKAKG